MGYGEGNGGTRTASWLAHGHFNSRDLRNFEKTAPIFFLLSLQNYGRCEGQLPAHRIRPGRNGLSKEGCLGKTRMA